MKRISFINRIMARWEKCVVDGCIFHETDVQADVQEDVHDPEVYRATDSSSWTFRDNTDQMKMIGYQGNIGSCVGFGTEHAIQITEGKLRRERKLKRNSIPSASWLFYLARMRHGGIKVPIPGTYIRYALEALRDQGCPAEKHRRYSTNPKKLNQRPTGKQQQAAMSRKGMKYQWIPGTGDALVKNIVSALDEGYGIVFGTQVTAALSRYKDGQVLHRPVSNEKLRGGHCMAIGGYRMSNGRVEFLWVNSWRGIELVWVDQNYMTWVGTRNIAVIKEA